MGAQHQETWFKDVLRLQPAHNMVVTDEGIRIYRYWNYPTKTDHKLTFDHAVKKYRDLFIDAVKIRMRSDVPVGTTLSSGIDSNSIVCTLRQFYKAEHHTFTAIFDNDEFDEFDKLSFADKNLIIDESSIVKGIEKRLNLTSHYLEIEYNNFVEDLKKIVFHLESGNSSPAVFPLMKVMTKAKEKVTVIMEGQGADELLAGYQQTLLVASVIEYLKAFNWIKACKIIKKTIKTYSFSYALILYLRQLSNNYAIIAKIYQKSTGIEDVFTDKLSIQKKMKDYPDDNEPRFDSNINTLLFKQHKGGLANLLHYGDAISMANSLESRLPFMDYRLVDFAFKLPWEFKLHNEYGKYIHRQAMKGIVPDSILDTALKFGFNTPISQFFKTNTNLSIKPKDILMSEKSLSRGLFNKNRLLKLFKEHEMDLKNHSTFLYRLFCVELWFCEFIDTK